MRSSLRLFGVLAVLAGVNIYVFFFNRGTAPREVLKPSSTVKAAEGKAGLLDDAARAEAERRGLLGVAERTPVPIVGTAAPTATAPKERAPQVMGPPHAGAPSTGGPKTTVAKAEPAKTGQAATAPPKGQPGGSPGPDDTRSVNPASSPEYSPASSSERKIGPTDTLARILLREGFEGDAVNVAAALSRLIDPKLLRGGQSYTVHLDDTGEPDAFEYHPNAVTHFVVTRAESRAWVATRVDQALQTKVESVAGQIESSLYESVQAAGESSALAGLLVELLAWDINFYTDMQPGDHWKVIVEKQYLAGRFYRYGHLLAAEYGGQVGTFRAFHWQDRPNAEGRYFDEKGQAITKSLLKTPLRFVRISSKFERHRFHPILHVEKAHLGIDYAAPVGTPVWASSSGKVVECEMKPGSGNTVVISHANGLATRYYHLSKFARGLKAGKLVRQKEVIGFVGTTGLSTGAHLHFSVTKNGAFIDPGKVQINRDAPVSEPAAYFAAIKPRVAALRAVVPAAVARN